MRILTALLLSTSLLILPTLPAVAQTPEVAETEYYQRKHISFFQRQKTALNHHLPTYLNKNFARFNYHLLDSTYPMDLANFLTSVKAYQQQIAGQAAANQSQEDIRFGDKVVTWSDTQQIMKSAFVFASHWDFTPIKLSKVTPKELSEDSKGKFKDDFLPSNAYTEIITEEETDSKTNTKKQVRKKRYWEVTAGSDLQLQVEIFDLSKSAPQKYEELRQAWDFEDTHYITRRDISEAERIMRRSPALRNHSFDISADRDQGYLLQIDRFVRIQRENPWDKYESRAVQELKESDGWASSIVFRLRNMDAFALKGQVGELNAQTDRFNVSFGDKESNASLDVSIRDSYRIYESRMEGNQTRNVEVGFAKIRGFQGGDVRMQPIITGRDPEPGDQIKETPKSEFNLDLSVGTLPFNYNNSVNLFNPAGFLSLEFATNATSYADVQRELAEKDSAQERANYLRGFDTESNFLLGGAVGGGSGHTFGDVHLGPIFRNFNRQLVFSWGFLFGWFMHTGGNEDEFLTYNAFGLTPQVGVQWQATPEIQLALDAGLRLYYPFFAAGPMLKGSVNFTF